MVRQDFRIWMECLTSPKKEILVQHQIIIIPGPAASTESAPEWYWGWGQQGRRSRLGRGSRRGWRCRRTGNWGTGQRSPLAEIVNLIMDWTSLSKLPKVSLPSSSPAGSWGRAAVRESTAARTRDCIWGKVIKMEHREGEQPKVSSVLPCPPGVRFHSRLKQRATLVAKGEMGKPVPVSSPDKELIIRVNDCRGVEHKGHRAERRT